MNIPGANSHPVQTLVPRFRKEVPDIPDRFSRPFELCIICKKYWDSASCRKAGRLVGPPVERTWDIKRIKGQDELVRLALDPRQLQFIRYRWF